MENKLSRYIWTHTRRQQLYILLVVALSMVPYFLSFDLPKQIVNGPIQGKGFGSSDATQIFFPIAFDIPYYGRLKLFDGVPLDRLQTLFALSLVFLVLVIVNGLFKLYINTYKGRLGERLLRRIRFQLVDRILRFPPQHFKRIKAAEIASMVKDEIEPLGGFTGDAFVQPALLGGQALTALFFILVQNFWLGLIAAFMVAIQGAVIPRMRRKLLILGRERQLTARELAGRVSEIVDGIGTIHAFDTSNYERADIAHRLGKIFKIRYDLYQWKFMVKFLNNSLAQLTPFLFYCIGGYLALHGRLDIGQLVAVISAYKDLPGPLKDLIDWDQTRQDVQVKYVQVVEQFTVDQVLDPSIQAPSDTAPASIRHPLNAVNLSLVDDSGAKLLQHVSMQIAPGDRVAVVGRAASGGDALAEAFGRLIWPEGGRVTAGGEDLLTLPESVSGRGISYASSEAYFFYGTLRDNLLYGLKHMPLRPAVYDEQRQKARQWEISEARLAGNPELDINSDWIDYAGANAEGPESFFTSILDVLDAVEISGDILDLALRSSMNPSQRPGLAERIVELRQALGGVLAEEGASGLVVPFAPGQYNPEATVGENLLFGTATGPELAGTAIGNNAYFRKVVTDSGLAHTLFEMGREIATNAVELFSDLPADHPFFQQLTFMTADDLPNYQLLLQKLKGRGFAEAVPEERTRIIRLSFLYIEPRHRFGLLTEERMTEIVKVRDLFHAGLPDELKGALETYDPNRYSGSASLLDNILFGRISNRHADGASRIRSIVSDMLKKRDLYDDVLEIGLDFEVGSGGRRLTSIQRQKINLARALIRRSDYYILNRPLPGLDHRLQEQIVRNVLKFLSKEGQNPAILWVLSNASLAPLFDRVMVFDRGALVGDGPHDELHEANDTFRQLVS
nr:ABC transporter transmembrane domain-containing protein [uncultured Gellertiella sp.]